MKVLLAHNLYKELGGEDSVFRAEGRLLRENGHDVFELTKSNEDISERGSLSLALGAIWSRRSFTEIRQAIKSIKPDIVHVHNYQPQISPAIFHAGRAEGVPVVQTLHNYRYLCLNGVLAREHQICEKCVTKNLKWPGVYHRCFRGSAMASATVAATLAVHKLLGTWRHRSATFIALTKFQRELLVRGGFTANRIHIKPNFCFDPGVPLSFSDRGTHGVFVGRLSHEKGVDVLLHAVSRTEVTVNLVGIGPKYDEVLARAPKNLHVHGYVDDADLVQLNRKCLFAILPSIVYEGFPMIIPEMFALGLPVIASRHGGMKELIEEGKTGLFFTPGSAEDLASRISWASDNREKMLEMGRNARRVYEQKYSPSRNHDRLMEIYATARDSLTNG